MTEQDLTGYLLPSVKNSVQSAIFQIKQNRRDRAKAFLDSAKKTLDRAIADFEQQQTTIK